MNITARLIIYITLLSHTIPLLSEVSVNSTTISVESITSLNTTPIDATINTPIIPSSDSTANNFLKILKKGTSLTGNALKLIAQITGKLITESFITSIVQKFGVNYLLDEPVLPRPKFVEEIYVSYETYDRIHKDYIKRFLEEFLPKYDIPSSTVIKSINWDLKCLNSEHNFDDHFYTILKSNYNLDKEVVEPSLLYFKSTHNYVATLMSNINKKKVLALIGLKLLTTIAFEYAIQYNPILYKMFGGEYNDNISGITMMEILSYLPSDGSSSDRLLWKSCFKLSDTTYNLLHKVQIAGMLAVIGYPLYELISKEGLNIEKMALLCPFLIVCFITKQAPPKNPLKFN